MGPRPTVVALIVLLMSSTLAGCIGLVPAREFLETRRDSVETVTVYDRVAFAHTFTNRSRPTATPLPSMWTSP